jgi:hypothetical protein
VRRQALCVRSEDECQKESNCRWLSWHLASSVVN